MFPAHLNLSHCCRVVGVSQVIALCSDCIVNTWAKWPTFCRRHFRCIYVNEICWILKPNSVKWVPWGLIDNKPVWAWRLAGAKPLPYLMLTKMSDVTWRHLATMSNRILIRQHLFFYITYRLIRFLITDFASWSHHDDVIKWKHFPHYWPSHSVTWR